jgi:phthiocerol/phenolphthiocerol synthesis type-I polyketide synthase E
MTFTAKPSTVMSNLNDIAVIGLEGRFPRARNVEEFWKNLCDGVHSISFFTLEEMEFALGNSSDLNNRNYVRAGGVLDDIESFDAQFFDFTPREAEVMDPQHRIFLECAWSALESAGYDPETYAGRIGVYAGAGMNSYLFNVLSNRDRLELVSFFEMLIGNEADHLPTKVSYNLNLKGPSINCQTACSTSLVAVSMACQGLLDFHCDMALAGGVSIKVPQKEGYLYEEGGINSPDGYCRAFDAAAQGTVGGNGIGLVVLKRLSDALLDGDCIHAVIKGFAINNDGSEKVGYTAPGVNGQTEVIAEALAVAHVAPETISYVEAHGTGTALGDSVEVAALTKAFRAGTDKRGFCALGSVKTNVGHLNTAAGVTGLIKTVLALKNKALPPTLHFQKPNPKIDFAASPFYVNGELTSWIRNGTPRRAGVSSFGIGGTNTHVIVEEAPSRESSPTSRSSNLLLLSAKTEYALENATTNLAEFLRQHDDINLADVAYTLQVGRRAFNHRRALVCRDAPDAVAALEERHAQRVCTGRTAQSDRSIAMMFSGQGAQYANMGRELYDAEPSFRQQIDLCADILAPHLKYDLRKVLYPTAGQPAADLPDLSQTCAAQPALFVTEYALAQLWMSWGVRPEAMIGHSIGEYVAACLAKVMSLEDALMLVAARGMMAQQLTGGRMLALLLPEADVLQLIRELIKDDERLSLAAVNSPRLCVVSGPADAVAELESLCEAQGIGKHGLRTSHAFHSAMMEPMLGEFRETVRKITLNPPQIPFISNLTGTWITTNDATNPDYWANHLRRTVRFAHGVSVLLNDRNCIMLEVGPGETLSAAVKQTANDDETIVLSSLRHPLHQQSDTAFLLNTLGRLWVAGTKIDWPGFYLHEERHRTTLPTYPFERSRYWIPLNRKAFADDANQNPPVEHLPDELPEALNERPEDQSHTDTAPANQIEQTIAGIWQELFGVESVGLHDNFFELGGNSLVGIQLMSRMRKVFMADIPMNSLFESPTVAGLANVVSGIHLKGQETEELEQLLAEIESLSPEEVELRLSGDLRSAETSTLAGGKGDMQFSLFFFSDDGAKDSGDKYHLLLECAKFADTHDFCAVWTPERHFQEFGGLYPNPAVLSSALAMITERIQIRAGSVALPLHNPIRVAEEWSVVDNLSKGRVGISFASGWHPLDFVLSPHGYQDRKKVLYEDIGTIQDLWAGKSVSFPCVEGTNVDVRILPRPIQAKLPTWISIAESAESWRRAGTIGANVLTAIVRQSLDVLETKIKLYREAREEAGHDPATGQVAVMLHTLVGEDNGVVKEIVRPHLTEYFRNNIRQLRPLQEILAKDLHAMSSFDPDNITDADLDVIGAYAFEQYFEVSLLCGTPEKCARLIDRLIEVGVSEVACFIDFGVDPDLVLESLHHLNQLRMSYVPQPASVV